MQVRVVRASIIAFDTGSIARHAAAADRRQS
jgi:hypothetical protein